jgi:hypothetical protein
MAASAERSIEHFLLRIFFTAKCRAHAASGIWVSCWAIFEQISIKAISDVWGIFNDPRWSFKNELSAGKLDRENSK